MAAAPTKHIFASSPGQVGVYKAEESISMTLLVEGMADRNGSFDLIRCVIQSVGLNEQVNAQLSPTLDKIMQIYTFGDRPASVEISGVHINNPCDDGDGGFVRLHKFFRTNRLSNRKTPIGITIGGKVTIRGFLMGLNLQTGDPQNGIGPFSLQLIYAPTGS